MLRLLLLHVTVAVAMPITSAVIPNLGRQYIDYVRGVHLVRQYSAGVGEPRAAAAVVAVEEGQQQRSKKVIDTASITLVYTVAIQLPLLPLSRVAVDG